ncbi:MAG TPA: GtrA family protein [Streptosporangiaceae bacterium]|nr:GtrA family protein [Streptosporangiaceae bacterium]
MAALYQRFRQQIHEGAKFGIVGLIGIGVTNLVFIPLHSDLHLGSLTSVTIATAVATVVAFLGNRYWSFRNREGAGTRTDGLMFFALNGVGLLIQYAVLGVTKALSLTTPFEATIAVNVGIGFGTLFRFWSYRKWIWVPPEVRLTQLRRGRHRKGRTVPIPSAPERQSALAVPTEAAGSPRQLREEPSWRANDQTVRPAWQTDDQAVPPNWRADHQIMPPSWRDPAAR